MNIRALSLPLAAAIGLALASFGCKQSGPPEPLPAEQAPTELTQAFTKARPELKDLASRASAALQGNRYPEASAILVELSHTPDLGATEREMVTRSMLTVNRLLQEAQAKGDPQAAEHLRRLQQSK